MQKDIFSAGFGKNADAVKKAAQSRDVSELMSKLSPEQTGMLEMLLKDEKKTRELLASPQAQALIKALAENER